MTKQHFLPATYLASFSSSNLSVRRERPIWVGDKQTGKIFGSRADKIAARKNLYTLIESRVENPNIVDEVWNEYEANLSNAINKLVSNNLDGKTWIRTLVPFVTCLFVRGPDFSKRFQYRFPPEWSISQDNINQARLLELQRLLTVISTAKWMVFKKSGEGNIITSDVGFAPFLDEPTSKIGITIPLTKNHILALTFRKKGYIAIIDETKWVPYIEYYTLLPNNHRDFNHSVASLAQRWIYGADETTIKQYLKIQKDVLRVPDLQEFGTISPYEIRIHEFTWHRLATILSQPPKHDKDYNFEIDYGVLSSGWHPVIWLPTNSPFYPSSIYIKEKVLYVDLYDHQS